MQSKRSRPIEQTEKRKPLGFVLGVLGRGLPLHKGSVSFPTQTEAAGQKGGNDRETCEDDGS